MVDLFDMLKAMEVNSCNKVVSLVRFEEDALK